MAVENVGKIRVDDTLEMGYYIDDCTDPWKTPETIILLHGCRKPRQVFYAWIPTLAREFRVIRPHIRGHWDSTSAPADYVWSVAGLIQDLRIFREKLNVGTVHFVGESLGGFLAYHLAYHHPDLFKTLTLVTAPSPSFKDHPIGKAGSMEVRHPVWGKDEKSRLQLLDEFGPEHRELAEWGYLERWKCPIEGTKGYFKAAAGCEVNVDAFLPKINIPTLYLMGADCTRIIPVQEAQRLCDLMPNAKLVTFPGIRSQCQFTMPERCAEEVVRFVKEQNSQAH